MLLNKSISIIGAICSGKTTLANLIANKMSYPIVSFGTYLRKYCQEVGLSATRENLQDIGEKMVEQIPEQFLSNVIANVDASKTIILEGVRHKKIFELIKLNSAKNLSIYLDVNEVARFNRLRQRQGFSGSFSDFIDMEMHPVEREIADLKEKCDLVLAQDYDATNVANRILKLM